MRNRYDIALKNEIVQEIDKGTKVKDINSVYPKIPESTIRGWYREYQQNGLFIDQSKNDAIPSWSGYNYQGKVMILCVLELINSLYKNGTMIADEWIVELEKLQDFVIKQNGIVKSLWQVKATLAKRTLNGYEDALDKLLEDRKDGGNITAKCSLVSAVDISGWNNASNQYLKDIELYRYVHKYTRIQEIVKLDSVVEYIKLELEQLMSYISIKEDVEDIYLVLCNLVDIKVSKFHIGGKKSKYEILFEEIIDCVKNYSSKRETLNNARIKETLYEYMSKVITESIELCCIECGKSYENCDEDCGVLKCFELTKCVDFDQYIRFIRPDMTDDNILGYIFDKEIYLNNICDVFKESEFGSIENLKNKIGLNLNYGKQAIIPTLVEFKSNMDTRISRKLEDIVKNKALVDNLEGCILSADTNNKIYNIKSDKFTYVNVSELIDVAGKVKSEKIGIKYIIEKEKSSKVTDFKDNVVIIDKDILIKYLGELKSDAE